MHDQALIAAGIAGTFVSIIHGYLSHKLFVKPLLATAEKNGGLRNEVRRLFPLLMQTSTLCWFAGGLALIAAPFWFDAPTRNIVAIIVGAFYALGAAGNFWATRGRHFGWIPLAIAVALIAYAQAG